MYRSLIPVGQVAQDDEEDDDEEDADEDDGDGEVVP